MHPKKVGYDLGVMAWVKVADLFSWGGAGSHQVNHQRNTLEEGSGHRVVYIVGRHRGFGLIAK